MKIVFLSNYFNHHQKPFSDEISKLSDYVFIATEKMTDERAALGWGREKEPDYVLHYDLEPQKCEDALKQADVVLSGSAPEELAKKCIKRGQVLFRYSERPLKKGAEWAKYLPRLVKWHAMNPFGRPIYMLCAGAYTAYDFARFGLFKGKTFKWGYFPEAKNHDVQTLMDNKCKASILWAGRFIDWKHPDDALRIARRLKDSGYEITLNMIGNGEMQGALEKMICENKLDDCVHLLGSMSPDEVRTHMERAQIYLFTSDRKEGWGAVLNESMNSGCAVVASREIGAVPYLLKDGENGLIYSSGDLDGLYEKVCSLLDAPEMAADLGKKAYETVFKTWNAHIAAERFLMLAEAALNGQDMNSLYNDGPCSRA